MRMEEFLALRLELISWLAEGEKNLALQKEELCCRQVLIDQGLFILKWFMLQIGDLLEYTQNFAALLFSTSRLLTTFLGKELIKHDQNLLSVKLSFCLELEKNDWENYI